MAAKARGRVRFNVGGKVFETTSTTLANAGRQSMLGALLDEHWNVVPDAPAEYFVDRNPRCFAVLLDLLRTGHLHIPPNLPDKLLFQEAAYYGLLDHVRAARWGTFDGNRLGLAGSVAGRAPGDGTAIRASPDGGCCVAHGSMVHIYDWMLEEHPPVSLNYQRINDAGYVDAGVVAVTASERPGRGDGGMAAFSASSGELRHKFEVFHGEHGESKSFTAGALAFNPAHGHIFTSCRGQSN